MRDCLLSVQVRINHNIIDVDQTFDIALVIPFDVKASKAELNGIHIILNEAQTILLTEFVLKHIRQRYMFGSKKNLEFVELLNDVLSDRLIEYSFLSFVLIEKFDPFFPSSAEEMTDLYPGVKDLSVFSRSDVAYDAEIMALAKRLISSKNAAAIESLRGLVKKGSLWDGDVPSKAGRDLLLEFDLAVRVISKGTDGFTAATYKGQRVLGMIGMLIP